MATCYLRVEKVFCENGFKQTTSYSIVAGSLPRSKATTSPAGAISRDVLKCNAVWKLVEERDRDDKVWIGVMAQKIFGGDDKIASLVIPLVWVPTNLIVKKWFPMKLKGRDWTDTIYCLVKIHRDTIGAERFKAPKGDLLVQPAWVIPSDLEQRVRQAEPGADDRDAIPAVMGEPAQQCERVVMDREQYDQLMRQRQDEHQRQVREAERRKKMTPAERAMDDARRVQEQNIAQNARQNAAAMQHMMHMAYAMGFPVPQYAPYPMPYGYPPQMQGHPQRVAPAQPYMQPVAPAHPYAYRQPVPQQYRQPAPQQYRQPAAPYMQPCPRPYMQPAAPVQANMMPVITDPYTQPVAPMGMPYQAAPVANPNYVAKRQEKERKEEKKKANKDKTKEKKHKDKKHKEKKPKDKTKSPYAMIPPSSMGEPAYPIVPDFPYGPTPVPNDPELGFGFAPPPPVDGYQLPAYPELDSDPYPSVRAVQQPWSPAPTMTPPPLPKDAEPAFPVPPPMAAPMPEPTPAPEPAAEPEPEPVPEPVLAPKPAPAPKRAAPARPVKPEPIDDVEEPLYGSEDSECDYYPPTRPMAVPML